MTLILSLCTPYCVLQASDRLVTRVLNRPATPKEATFDAASNKNVIYRARNALVAIGYSGPAYLDEITTDSWIAEKLHGKPLDDDLVEEGYIEIGRAPQWLDIGNSLRMLKGEIEQVFARTGQKTSIYVSAAGWQWPSDRLRLARPVLYELFSSRADPGKLEMEWPPRNWHLEPNYPIRLGFAPSTWLWDRSPLSREDADYLGQHLTATWLNPKNAVGPLVQAVRRQSRKSLAIGEDCMVINLPHPSNGLIEAVYDGGGYHKGVMTTVAGKKVTYPVAYSPWVVGPYELIPPMLVSGTFQHELGPVTVKLIGPEHDPGSGPHVRMALLGQKRPPLPK